MNSFNIEQTIDPLEAFVGVKHSRLIAATGLIPYFVQDVAMSVPTEAQEAYDMLGECYGFPMNNMLASGEGEVSDEGVYSFPGDKNMSPMVKWTINGEKDTIEILMYQYAFVVVRDKATTLMTRMD